MGHISVASLSGAAKVNAPEARNKARRQQLLVMLR
jgi:hypothetical protein